MSTLFNCIVIVLSLVAVILSHATLYYSSNLLRVDFFDVGQGDSFLITTPDKLTILVDGGPDLSAATKLEQRLAIWDDLDYVLMTHPDSDHVGSLKSAVEGNAVKGIFANLVEHQNPAYDGFKQVISEKELPLHEVSQGDVWQIGCCVVMKFMWPPAGWKSDVNESSLGFLLEYGNFRLLAAGDLSTEYELAMWDESGGIDLLKVGHHGSKTSTGADFLELVRPHTAVIQSGKGNSYGHPSPEVLANLANAGVDVYRTDTLEDIAYLTDGQRYKLLVDRL